MELKVGDFGLAACQDVSDQKKKYVSYSRILQGFTLLPPVASQESGGARGPSWASERKP